MKQIICIILTIISVQNLTYSQSKWQRAEPLTSQMSFFRSLEAFSLPTTETLQQGNIYFHISHKFLVPVSEGAGELFGFDGGVYMRLALGYGITDDIFAALGRSNHDGNYDLQIKGNLLETEELGFPLAIAVNGGAAYNSKFTDEPEDKSKLWQFYGNLILNTKFGKLGLGLVPSFLYNSYIPCPDCQTSTTLGMYAQYFFNERWSVIAEANPTLNGWRRYYDTYSIGAEIETAGHFFKVFVSNNVYTNMSQYLSGAVSAFDKGDVHICFIITRVL